MQQLKIPRKWYVAIIGLSNWKEKAKILPHDEYLELQEELDDFLEKTHRQFRRKGAINFSLFWSDENLAPIFLLEYTNSNEKFLKQQREIFTNVTESIFMNLTSNEQNSSLGKNLKKISPVGKVLLLECNIPFNIELFPDTHQILEVFSDAFNSELRTIKRSAHDFSGRKEWLSTVNAILARDLILDVGPIKKIREIKKIMTKRQYENENPGDFEKIERILSDIIPYRTSLFELEKPSASIENRKVLGHIIIQYISTKGDFPIKPINRSTTFDRIGRKLENYQWILKNEIDWRQLDRLIFHTREIIYDKFEKVILDVGGIKLENLWTDTNLGNNAYFLSKFDFTDDILKQIKTIKSNPRKLLEEQIGVGTTKMFELWEKAGLHFNVFVFEVRGLDGSEDKNLSNWVKLIKQKEVPGPNYGIDLSNCKRRQFRPY